MDTVLLCMCKAEARLQDTARLAFLQYSPGMRVSRAGETTEQVSMGLCEDHDRENSCIKAKELWGEHGERGSGADCGTGEGSGVQVGARRGPGYKEVGKLTSILPW